MASTQQFVDFVLDQIVGSGTIHAKKMFGEYGIYANEKIFGLICDDTLYLKSTESGRNYMGEIIEASPYPGAKPHLKITDQIEDSKWLSELVRITVNELPIPKPKKSKPANQ